ncbi:hypothetical protein U3516DRAFT_781224 [Neocallimastix sp. 'constans']
MEKPDAINEAKWSNYITQLNQNDLVINDKSGNNYVKIHITYDTNEPIPKNNNKKYADIIKNTVSSFSKPIYDMFIIDEKLLYSDSAKAKSDCVKIATGSWDYYKNYVDLTNEIQKEDLKYHSEDILNKGYFKDHLYALPFELDFDVLYYPNNINLSKLDFENSDWDELLSKNIGSNGKNTMSIAYGEKDELLDLFIEYVEAKFDNFYNNENDHFDLLYGDESNKLFSSFKDLVKNFSINNINSTLEATYIDAYNAVFSSNESNIFFGKASHYQSIAQLSNANQVKLSASLPPKNYDVVNAKYIVINKNSKLDKDLLINTAKKITSREMQLQRSELIGSVPTFDLKSNDEAYCQSGYSEICEFVKKMKQINIKKVFESPDAAPFMEVRMFIPETLSKYILGEFSHKEVVNVFSNIKYYILEKPEFWKFLIFGTYIPCILSSIFIIVITYYTYKFRNSPHIKYLSPGFCVIILIGFLLNADIPVIHIFLKSNFMAIFNYLYDTINTIFFFLPMLFVTYRIYSIYNNTTNYNLGEKLNNKSLYTLFAIIFVIWTGYGVLVCIFTEVYVQTKGSIFDSRRVIYNYVFDNQERIAYRLYYIGCIIACVYMVGKLGYVKKRYGEFKFVYMMVFALIFEHVLHFVTLCLNIKDEDAVMSLVVSNILLTLTYTVFAYVLLGNKLIYLIKHPEEVNSTQNKVTRYDFSTGTFQYVDNSISFKGDSSNNSKINYEKSKMNKSQSGSLNDNNNISHPNTFYSNTASYKNNLNNSTNFTNTNTSFYNNQNNTYDINNSVFKNLNNSMYNGQNTYAFNNTNSQSALMFYNNQNNSIFNNNQINSILNNYDNGQKNSNYYRSQLLNNLK